MENLNGKLNIIKNLSLLYTFKNNAKSLLLCLSLSEDECKNFGLFDQTGNLKYGLSLKNKFVQIGSFQEYNVSGQKVRVLKRGIEKTTGGEYYSKGVYDKYGRLNGHGKRFQNGKYELGMFEGGIYIEDK